MNIWYVLNIFFIFFSAWAASKCESWSWGWWLNVFASALNAAIVMKFIIG